MFPVHADSAIPPCVVQLVLACDDSMFSVVWKELEEIVYKGYAFNCTHAMTGSVYNVEILTDSADYQVLKNYWNALKKKKVKSELVTSYNWLKWMFKWN